MPPTTGPQLITPHLAAEALFGLAPVHAEGRTATGSMRTEAWMTDASGRPSAGMLGVLVDDVVGQAALTARPDGCWPVTTELSIDVLDDLPADGSTLTATGELLAAGERTGTARGEVRGPSGRLLAVATVATQYVPGVPDVGGEATAAPPLPSSTRHLHEAVHGLLERGATGCAALEVPRSPALENVTGRGHGGVLVALGDVVAAAAVADEERPPLRTSGLRITFLRPAVLDGALSLTARCVHRGRSTALTRVEVTGGDGRLCAAATITACPGA
ncbi:PaaI family thioesterase [Actinomycetospora sp.]|jgi:uncharacterized protein (TIGR00369 family)|uniref:PaaI family thioesterase n=1 Tax=Actinomycetospora sp. TaxID=1872135 RepID=UPI002F3E5963